MCLKFSKMLKINKLLRSLSRFFFGSPFLTLFLLHASLSSAQSELTQTLRGRVVDAVTNAPIPSASVILMKEKTLIARQEATESFFRFEKTPVGRYEITAQCIGYQSIKLSNIIVESGKETVIELKLTTSTTLLDSFEVRSTTTEIAKIGLAQSVNMEALQRLPANFNDVARMLTTVAGVSAENDGANHIAIRGISPNALQWFLEGAEIVNPNHLSNAGTVGDRATQNGGGVSIFSTQVLDRADFYKGSTPTDYGNALGGAIDVRFRNGNNERRETTLGIGLIGLDVATEGSFTKNSKASYLINYRYSTVGLLSKLGVPLGDEASSFQDISFKLNFPTRKLGDFAVFGMGGISENIFEHKKRVDWKTQKDSQDITFKNRMGAVGATHSMSFNKNTSWQTVVALSALESNRLAVGLSALELPVRVLDFNNIHRKFFVKTQVNRQFKANVLSVGMVIKNEFVDSRDSYRTQSFRGIESKSRGEGMWYMPFANFSGKIGSKWDYSAGFRANYFSFTDKFSLEPTAMVQRKMGQNAAIQLTYSRQSQLLLPPQYFRTNNNIYFYKNADFIKSDNVNLTFNKRFANNIQLSATAFGQFYRNIFVVEPQFPPRDYWSILDGLGDFSTYGNQSGTAQSIGIEANINQNNRNGWFWQVNATIFEAEFKEPSRTRPMGYNSKYIFNGYIGKEWTLGSRKNRFLGVGSRTVLRGGNWLSASTALTQVAPYFRTDLNVYIKRNRKNWSSTLQLDIQNATNRLNEQYYYFDNFTQKGAPQYQLGLLPNLSYRIAF
jgi:hypothetical protein